MQPALLRCASSGVWSIQLRGGNFTFGRDGGGTETLGLIARKFGLSGGIWDVVAGLNDSFGMLGYLIIAVFAACWIGSMAIYRLKGYDAIEVPMAPLAHEKLPA